MGKRKNTLWGMFREAAVSVLRDVAGGGGGTIERAPGLLPVGTILGLDDMVDAYTASSVACVKRCVEIKAGSVASLGLHAMRRRMEDGRTWYEDAEGTLADRLLSERPNPRQTGFDLLWQVVYQREMYGNAYIVPVYRGGVLSALYCVPSDCSVSYDRLRGVYTVSDIYDGIEGEYMPDEIIHIRSYCRDGFLGTPVTELASLVLSNARKAYKQEGEMFTPGSTLRGFITGEDTVQVGYGGATDKQLKGVTQRIREAIGSGQNLNFLPGTMKFVQTGMTPSDLQLLDSMKFINMEICRFFGVPPMQVFQDTNANYSSTESSQTIFMTSTLAPPDASDRERGDGEAFRRRRPHAGPLPHRRLLSDRPVSPGDGPVAAHTDGRDHAQRGARPHGLPSAGRWRRPRGQWQPGEARSGQQ